MRLTLRTLLAYLDDRLAPANAREIGQRISRSPFATELVDRIREVKRQRRLTAPGKPQRTVDPNLIAEYLDDQLTPELVARVEQEILSSDFLLAEVAAAHEILGLLKEPVRVEPRLQERLYGLDPTGQTDVLRAAGAEPARHAASTVAPWKPLGNGGPATGRRLAVIAAVLGFVWLLSVASDSILFDGSRSAPDAPAAADSGVNALALSGEDGNAAEVSGGAADVVGIAPAEVKDVNAPVADAGNANRADGPDAANGNPTDASASEAAVAAPNESVAAANATEIASAPVPDVPIANAEVPPPPRPEAAVQDPVVVPAATPPFQLRADPRSLLVLDAAQQRWSSMVRLSGGDQVSTEPNATDARALLQQSWFGVPDRFRFAASFPGTGWTARVDGRSLLSLPADGRAGLNVLDARMIVRVDSANVWDEAQPPVMNLQTGSVTAAISLLSEGTWLAIEVVPAADVTATVPDEGPDPSPLPLDADLLVQVMTVEGAARVQLPDTAEPFELPAGQMLLWKVLDQKALADVTPAAGPGPAAAPQWIFRSDAPEPQSEVDLLDRLAVVLAESDEPGDAVLPLLDDRNVQAGLLAVHALAEMRDIDRLVSILFEQRDEVVHRAAIDGLSGILNSSMGQRQITETLLGTRLPMVEVGPMMHLLTGLTLQELSDPQVATDLLGLLASDRLLTRTLAIYRMEQATKDRQGFQPAAESSRRREAIRRWQKYLERNDGKLIP